VRLNDKSLNPRWQWVQALSHQNNRRSVKRSWGKVVLTSRDEDFGFVHFAGDQVGWDSSFAEAFEHHVSRAIGAVPSAVPRLHHLFDRLKALHPIVEEQTTCDALTFSHGDFSLLGRCS
jgi:hypothetical protein